MPEPAPAPPAKRRGSRITATLRALVRTRISAGLLIVLPVYVTLLLLKFVFELMRDSSQWVVMALLHNAWVQEHVWKVDVRGTGKLDVDNLLATYPALDWGIAFFSVLLTICILYAVGVFAANLIGRRVIEFFEGLLDRVPIVKTVYRASKQILATFTGEQSQNFQRVALVPFPQEKMRCIGFVTSLVRDTVSGEIGRAHV